ncbi:MAG: hypothetical protein AB7T74_04280 [Clostridia bacterium]
MKTRMPVIIITYGTQILILDDSSEIGQVSIISYGPLKCDAICIVDSRYSRILADRLVPHIGRLILAGNCFQYLEKDVSENLQMIPFRILQDPLRSYGWIIRFTGFRVKKAIL